MTKEDVKSNSPIDWLVVGIGDIARKRVIPAILSEPRSRLAGIVTRDPAKAAPYGVPAWTGLDRALAESGATAVYVATPVFLHAPQAIASLERGRDVLLEKPVAMDYAEACAIRDAAVHSGRTLGVAYYRRMYPKVDRARELVAAGVIGTPFMAWASSHDWLRHDGFASDWRARRALAGGGPLYDIASHRIDLMNWMFGKPARASGHISSLVHQTEVEDNATVLIEYENGVRGIVDVRWHSRVVRDEFRIRGTAGEIDLTPLNGPELVYPGAEERIPAHPNLHYPMIANFVAAVVDGAPLRSSGESAILTDWITGEVLAAPGN